MVIAFGFYKFFSGSWQFTADDERAAVVMDEQEKKMRRSLDRKMRALISIIGRIDGLIQNKKIILDPIRPGLWEKAGKRQATKVEHYKIEGVSLP
jgi:hypothetical protein